MAYLSLAVSLMRKGKRTEDSNLWRERNSWFLYQFALLKKSARAVMRTESGHEPAHSSTKAAPRVDGVWQLSLCTEHFKIAMFVSWPSTDLSSLDINISADLIPVNGGLEVKWNGIHLRSLLHIRLEGWLSRWQASTSKHGFNQDLVLPRNVNWNFPGARN